jgi:hypothetical protein
MALTIQQLKEKYPLFRDESDDAVFEYLHKNQYSRIPRPQLAEALGYQFPDKPLSSDLKEFGHQFAGGVEDFNKMAGAATQVLSPEDSGLHDWGAEQEAGAKERLKNYEYDPEGRGLLAQAMQRGARALPPSAATMLPYAIPGVGMVAGPAATVGLFGPSSYKETRDAVLAKGGTEEEAHLAGLKTGAINSVGEFAGNALSLGMLGMGKKVLGDTVEGVIKGAVDTTVLKPFAKSYGKALAGETATEEAQSIGEEAVLRDYGVGSGLSYGEIAKDTALATFGMTTLLGLPGLHNHYRNAQHAQHANDLLDSTDPALSDQRAALVTQLHAQAKANGAKDADEWLIGAKNDIANNQPIRRAAKLDVSDVTNAGSVDEAIVAANAAVNAPSQAVAEQAGEDARAKALELVNESPADQEAYRLADQAGADARAKVMAMFEETPNDPQAEIIANQAGEQARETMLKLVKRRGMLARQNPELAATQAGEQARQAALALAANPNKYDPVKADKVATKAGEQARNAALGVVKQTRSGAPEPIYNLIAEKARKHGVSLNAMLETARIETGGKFNPDAKNPNSTAGGLYQFLDSSAQNYKLANKYDAAQSADAAARMMKDNAATLFRALGRVPTDGELYLAHQQGGAGAARLLANPNALASTIVGREAVRLNGGKPNMTAGEFASLWTNKVRAEQSIEQTAAPYITPDFNAEGQTNTGLLKSAQDTSQPEPQSIPGNPDEIIQDASGNDLNPESVASPAAGIVRADTDPAQPLPTVQPATQAETDQQTLDSTAVAANYPNSIQAKKALKDYGLGETHTVEKVADKSYRLVAKSPETPANPPPTHEASDGQPLWQIEGNLYRDAQGIETIDDYATPFEGSYEQSQPPKDETTQEEAGTKDGLSETNSPLKPSVVPPNTYHPGLYRMVNDLQKGGGVTYLTDQHGTITGRTTSLNPDWFQNFQLYKEDGTPYAGKPSTTEIKAAFQAYEAGDILSTKQQLILQGLSEMVQDEEDRAEAAYQAEGLSPFEAEIAREIEMDLESALEREAIQNEADLPDDFDDYLDSIPGFDTNKGGFDDTRTQSTVETHVNAGAKSPDSGRDQETAGRENRGEAESFLTPTESGPVKPNKPASAGNLDLFASPDEQQVLTGKQKIADLVAKKQAKTDSVADTHRGTSGGELFQQPEIAGQTDIADLNAEPNTTGNDVPQAGDDTISESILASQTIEFNGKYVKAGDLLNNIRDEIAKYERFITCVRAA